jgi:hypothetical protein
LTISEMKQIGGRAGRFQAPTLGKKESETTTDSSPSQNLPDAASAAPTELASTSENTNTGGLVTTLNSADLPTIAQAMKLPYTPTLQRATINWTADDLLGVSQFLVPGSEFASSKEDVPSIGRLASPSLSEVLKDILSDSPRNPDALPTPVSFSALLDIIRTCSTLGPYFQLPTTKLATDLERELGVAGLTLSERHIYMSVPQGNKIEALQALLIFVQEYRENGRVELGGVLRRGRLEGVVEGAEEVVRLATKGKKGAKNDAEKEEDPHPPPQALFGSSSGPFFSAGSSNIPLTPAEYLDKLESLHRILTMYAWLHHRQSMVYCDAELAKEMGGRVQRLLVKILEGMRVAKKKAAQVGAKEVAGASDGKQEAEESDEEELKIGEEIMTGEKDEIPYASVSSLLTQ